MSTKQCTWCNRPGHRASHCPTPRPHAQPTPAQPAQAHTATVRTLRLTQWLQARAAMPDTGWPVFDAHPLRNACSVVQDQISTVTASKGELTEWVTLAVMVLDGAVRHGHSPESISQALAQRMTAEMAVQQKEVEV